MAEEEAGGEVGRSDWWVAVRGIVGDDLGTDHVSTRKRTFVQACERGVRRKNIRGWVRKDVVKAVYEKHV